jgi:hypothetical protein
MVKEGKKIALFGFRTLFSLLLRKGERIQIALEHLQQCCAVELRGGPLPKKILTSKF